MPDIYGVMSNYNQQLAKREAAEMLAMARRWGTVEKRLWVYFDALIDDIARTGVKTDAQIMRLYRYEQLVNTAQNEIAQYEAWAGSRIIAEQRRAMDVGFEAAVRTAAGDSFFPPMVDKTAVANMIGMCADGAPLFSVLRRRALATASIEGLTNALVEAVALGYNPRKTARFMADGLAQGLDKALLIARTEQIRVMREATRSGYQQMGVTRYRRHCAKSDRTCVACLALDGKIYKTDMIMDSHPGCILPGNEVVAADLLGASKAFYDGRAIEILVADGRRITVTPNHPILTDRGWIAAKFLQEGVNVIVATDCERVAHGINPDYQYRPTKIEEVFRSLEESIFMTKGSVKFSSEDFHGDAEFFNGDIDVVFPDSFLRRNGKPLLHEPGCQFDFSRRNVREQSLLGSRTPDKALKRQLLSAHSRMSAGREYPPFFSRHISHTDEIGFSPIANSDAIFEQPFSKGSSGYARFFGKSKFAFSGDVSFDEGCFDNGPASRPGILDDSALVFTTETGLNEALGKNFPVYTDLLGQFLERFSAEVAAVQVVKVRDFNFRGHVYDLQTSEYSLFMVNSIIAHNCRCFMTAVIPGVESERASAQEWFAGRGEEWQRQVLGKERFELYKQGVPLAEMAQVHNDPVWGPTLGVKSLRAIRHTKDARTITRVPMEVGRVGSEVESVFRDRTSARTVMTTEDVLDHIEKHKKEFDTQRATQMLSGMLRDPLWVYQGKKKTSVVFVEDFSDRFFLLVPVKLLPEELWLETIHIEEKARFLRRWKGRKRLYERGK